jgi:hypothetical protein
MTKSTNIVASADHIRQGNALLFVGAGFSAGATATSGKTCPTATDLAQILYEMIGEAPDNDLEFASDRFVEERSEHSLIQTLKHHFTIKEFPAFYRQLLALDWRRIYTTNYDNLIERVKADLGVSVTPVTLADNPIQFKDKRNLCIHLNGFIDRLTPETLGQEFKLTQASYQTESFVRSPWVTLFRNDMQACSSAVFVGFSLDRDLDIKRVILNTSDQKAKTVFVVGENESDRATNKLSRFGTCYPIGAEKFAKEISDAVARKPRSAEIQTKLVCFEEIKPGQPSGTPSDIDSSNLYFYGLSNRNHILSSMANPDVHYYLKRGFQDDVIASIESGIPVVVHGDMGNGKTLFAEGIAVLMATRGYRVFRFSRYHENLNEELEHIASLDGKTLLVVESYHQNLRQLGESIKVYSNSDVRFLLTERTLVNDIAVYKLEEEFFSRVAEYDLNLLTDDEIHQLVATFDNLGYWGEIAGKSPREKASIAVDECGRRLRLFLVHAFGSVVIRKKFQNLVRNIQKQESFFRAVLLVLIDNIFGLNLHFDDIVYILGDETLNNSAFSRSNLVREVLDVSSQTIRVRSPIISEVILNTLDDLHGVMNLLTDVARYCDEHFADQNLKGTLKNLTNFATLQRAFGQSAHALTAIIGYYENIKGLYRLRQDPLFWLQYAIAMLAVSDYERADRYFGSAYSYANKKDWFDPFQLDNHFARYILEFEIYYGSQKTSLSQFRKAHEKLMRPSPFQEKMHYPFKVAQNYQAFYLKYFAGFSESERQIFLKACRDVLERAEHYLRITPKYKVSRYVVECRKRLLGILEENDA